MNKMLSFRKFILICRFNPINCYFNRSLSSSSRPIAKFDQCIENEFNTVTSEPRRRKHPGVFNRRTVQLPERLKNAAEKIIKITSADETLLENAKNLKNHLIFKKAPLSEFCVKEIEAKCTEKVLATYPILDFSYLTAEDEKRITNSQNSKIRKTVNQNAYRWRPVVYNQTNSLAYLLTRLAPDYASLYRIFNEISSRDPDFQPQTMFDFGSGLGSALWAAKSCWGVKKFKEAFCVDSSIDMNNLALALLQDGIWPKQDHSISEEVDQNATNSTLKGMYFRQFMPASNAVKYDLVVCAHSLLELPSAEIRLQTALSLWRKSQGYLVFVEHGSRAAYEVIVEVRDFLLSFSKEGNEANLQGHVFAPCPHDSYCPRLTDKTPCNFEVKYEPLSRNEHIQKERFSYVVLKKGLRSENDPNWPRVVRPVLVRSGHTVCRLCTKEGKLEEIVVTRSKHSSAAHRYARKTEWGDLLPVTLSPHVPPNDEMSPTAENEEKP